MFFSLTFAVVHHGSTWLTKITHSQHQNVRKATHYDHETLAFPPASTQNFIKSCCEYREPILTYDEYRVDCRDKDPY